MKFQTLRSYVDAHTQTVAAARLGVTQGYISQTLRADRVVRVAETKSGPIAVELKPYGHTAEPAMLEVCRKVSADKLERK